MKGKLEKNLQLESRLLRLLQLLSHVYISLCTNRLDKTRCQILLRTVSIAITQLLIQQYLVQLNFAKLSLS